MSKAPLRITSALAGERLWAGDFVHMKSHDGKFYRGSVPGEPMLICESHVIPEVQQPVGELIVFDKLTEALASFNVAADRRTYKVSEVSLRAAKRQPGVPFPAGVVREDSADPKLGYIVWGEPMVRLLDARRAEVSRMYTSAVEQHMANDASVMVEFIGDSVPGTLDMKPGSIVRLDEPKPERKFETHREPGQDADGRINGRFL